MNKKFTWDIIDDTWNVQSEVNDMTYKSLTMNFPVWEAIFFRALSGSIISFFSLSIWININQNKKPVRHFVRAFFSSWMCCSLYIWN